jgi:CzcA family heavy metal efflux pump
MSLKFRLLMVALAAGMLAVGIAQLRAMPVDVLPEFSAPYVEVQTEALGLSAEEVEQLITIPLEQDLLNGVPWLNTIHSESLPGVSTIFMTFDQGTDLMRARQMVTERMAQAFALPHVSKPPTMIQPLSSTNRVMMVGLSSKDVSMIQLGVLARWTIAPRLMGVPGVANVAIWGQRDRQLQVQVDPKRLKEHDVSLLQILETTGNALWVSSLSFVEASTPGTGGFIDTAQQRLGIRHISPITTSADLAQVPVEDATPIDGKIPRRGDVASVIEDHQPLIGDALTNDGPSLLLVIEKFPGSNTLDVTHGVEEALAAMQPGLPGVEVNTSLYRPANFIEQALGNLSMVLILGSVLLVLAFGALLFDWRAALIGLIAIPVALVAGALVLYLRGATMNTMVLAGFVIAVGVVVDDAITGVENIMRRLRQARQEESDRSNAAIILDAALEMRSALLYATLIVLLAVAPVFFIQGEAGSFFQPLALSYVLAVLASMVVALLVTPALCLLLLRKASVERRASPLVGWLQRGYERGLSRIIQRPRTIFVAVALITIVGIAIIPFLNQSLLPSFKERNLLVQLRAAPGTSQPEMSRISGLVSRELQSIPGIIDVGAHVGRAIQGDQPVNVDSAELWVSVDPAANYGATVAQVQKVVNGYPGIHHTVQTYLNERSSAIVPEADKGLVVRVFGDTTDVLRKTAEDVKQTITGINGIVDSSFTLPVQQPTMEIEVDLDAAQRYGLKPGDVRRAAATLLSGIQVGNLFQDQKVFDVVVWGTPETRNSLNSVHDLLIDTPGGEQVRLGDVAEVRMVPAESVIRHDAVKRYLDVRVNVQGRDPGAVAADITGRLQQMQFPLEYHAEVLGGYTDRQAAQTRLLILVIAVAIAMFFLLQAAFGSWRLAAVSFVTLPSALVGGVIAALLGGGGLSLGMLGGLLAVFGIAARTGILLITHYQHLERYEGETFGPALVLRGSRERLAPIMTTAIATALVLVPFIVFGNSAGLEIVAPMALVILGGLITSTLLSLFVAPVVYLQFGSSPAPEMLGAELSYQPSFGLAYAGHPHSITAQIDGEASDGALRERAIGD